MARRSGPAGAVGQAAFAVALCAVIGFVLFPIYWLTVRALASPNAVGAWPPAPWPPPLTWLNFRQAFDQYGFQIYIRNSLVVASAATVATVCLGSLAGFGLARMQVRGRPKRHRIVAGPTAVGRGRATRHTAGQGASGARRSLACGARTGNPRRLRPVGVPCPAPGDGGQVGVDRPAGGAHTPCRPAGAREAREVEATAGEAQTGTGPVRPTVILGVTGSVAAFKAADIAAYLRRGGARVLPVLTEAGSRFITPLTLSAMAGEATLSDLWQSGERSLHLDVARADLMVVAPATADFIARAAMGRADDLLAAALLARGAGRPVLIAPAMESELWRHPLTQANVERLRALGHETIGPVRGALASGGVGMGRMAAVDDIVARALDMLAPQDLAGVRVLVTAGPTQEPIDAVRYLGNRSSGRMGYSVARRARARGAETVLVSGPVALAPPPGVRLIRVQTAEEMRDAMVAEGGGADLVVAAAAVADFTPVAREAGKIRRGERERLSLELVRTADVLAAAVALPGREGRTIVGFAAEVGDPAASALDKCRRKGLDLCVGNDIADPDSTFGAPTDRVVLASPDGSVERLPLLPKEEVADRILDRAARLSALRGAARA